MIINTQNMMSITDINQNFSKAARLVDKNGYVVILKNNVPVYTLSKFQEPDERHTVSDDTVMNSSQKFLKRNKSVYEALAK